MEREGVPRDTITYNSLLKAAAACGLLPEARSLYAEMRGARLPPSTFTYAALFNAAARARAGDAEWLLEVRGAPGCCPAGAWLAWLLLLLLLRCSKLLTRLASCGCHPTLPCYRRLTRWWRSGCSQMTMWCRPCLLPPPTRPARPPSWTGSLPRWRCCAGAARGAALLSTAHPLRCLPARVALPG